MGSMQGRVAVVTGGSAGIGRATALAFGREGVNVVIADVDDTRGEQAATEVAGLGVDALFAHAGRRGRGGFAELVLGSTTYALTHHLDRPLVIVP